MSRRCAAAARATRHAARAGRPVAGRSNGAYAEKLVLVRPDQHIAWRGQVAPENPDALIARITGAAGANVEEGRSAALPA